MVFKWLRDTIEEERKRLREQIDKALKKISGDTRVETVRETIRDIWGEVRDDYLETLEKILGYDPKSDIYFLQDFNKLLSQIGLNPPYPRIDILDDENKLNMIIDVPGFSKENIELECAPNKIVIRGKVDIEGNQREIDKIINLPRRVVPGEAVAKLKNGILIVKLPLSK
ncbi:MAG: Hsp20/alpha crystallin family protein [Candidatus Hodarchaeota archaeon]